jgi:hypothetical protein
MILTQGEKMVWAAAFVADLEWIRNNPRLMPGLTPGEVVDGSYRHSIRHANGVVKRLREAAIKLRDDDEVDDRILRAMMGDEE